VEFQLLSLATHSKTENPQMLERFLDVSIAFISYPLSNCPHPKKTGSGVCFNCFHYRCSEK
jgi:hypothetical protein